MGWAAMPLPVVWAQATTGNTAPTPVSNAAAMASLTLRRWCGSLTLGSPETSPGWLGLWAWLAGLGLILLLALVFQGPRRAVGQLFDVPGHVRLFARAGWRLRRAGRLLAVVIGLTVLSWTGSQAVTYNSAQGRDDVVRLTKSRGPLELALEQGSYAALIPLRDVAGLGGNLALLTVATVVLFRATADSWSGSGSAPSLPKPPGWASVGWACGALYVLYRLVAMLAQSVDLPLGGCLMVEALVVPALMALVDGTVLAWVLVELRDAAHADPDGGGFGMVVREASGLIPAATVACVLTLPARYTAAGVLLASYHLPTSVNASAVGDAIRWNLGTGLAVWQGGALALAGFAGAVVWAGGSVGESARVYARVLSTQGARLAVVLGVAGLAAGVGAGGGGAGRGPCTRSCSHCRRRAGC